MTRRAELLYKLQRIDTNIMKKKRRYNQVKASLGESEALIQARQALKAARAELTEWKTTLRDQELSVGSVTAKQKETEDLLYSGRVKNPKELDDLQKENQYLKRRKAKLEEKQLESMMKVEETRVRFDQAKQAHSAVEAEWKAENAELAQEYDQLKAELTRLLSKRKGLIKHIDQHDLEEYMSIRKVRQGIAVSVVRNNMCQICQVKVPQRSIDKARDTDELLYCGGCDRIIYVPR